MASVGVLGPVFLGFLAYARSNFAPERNARVHLRFHQLRGKHKAEIGVLFFGQQVGAKFDGLGILGDDNAILDGPVVFKAFPP